MSPDIKFTERDAKILSFLHTQGVATLSQLEREFFRTHDYCKKRLSILGRFGLIDSVRFSKGISQVPSRMIELRQKIEQEGKDWRKVKLYRINAHLLGNSKFQSPLSEPIFWQHQIGLGEIRHYLSKVLGHGVFLSDPQSKKEWARFRMGGEVPIPDLVWRGSDTEFAIEFERTNKGEYRYYDRMARYQRSGYHRILYVAKNQTIADFLTRCGTRFPKVGITLIADLRTVFVGLPGFESIQTFLEIPKS